jgi:tRNA A-37 threonylcarbamoyl transferase component Bud32
MMGAVPEGWGKYQLHRTIATGATGTVYVAYEPGLHRHVAIKELSPKLIQQPMFLDRFRDLVRIMVSLQSINCVRTYEFFETDGRAFLVQEYINGASLRQVIDKAGRPSPAQALGVLKGALSGLGYAHSQGLLHRDFRPENVLVDHEGIVKVTDFGQALAVSGPGAMGGLVYGTPAYMSPEQVAAGVVDYRSDVYSAGAVLFELLTGRPPYIADRTADVMRMHIEAPVPDPRTSNPSIPENVAGMVAKTLAKDPASRYQSATEFYHELSTAAAAGYGWDWESRSSVKPLVATALAAAPAATTAMAAAGGPPGVAAINRATDGSLPPISNPTPAVLPPPVHPLRVLLGLVLSTLLILGGLGFGGSKGVLPAGLASASGKYFGDPAARAPASTGTGEAAGAVPVPRAGAADSGSATAMVLDISGSMDSPAQIPKGFPRAAELKQKQDAFGSLLEQAQSGKKVPAGVVIAGVSGIVDLVKLSTELNDYLKAHGTDPATISKLSALKVSTRAMLETLAAESQGLGLNHRAGLVTFSDSAIELASLGTDMGALATQVDALTTQGSTNIGDGLTKALAMVQEQPGAGIVLLTDGWNNTGMTDDQILSGPVTAAVAKGVPICTIGIGESPFDVDQAFLTQVAAKTGGAYYFVGDRVSLAADMIACHHTISGQKLTEYQGRVSPGQSVTAPAFSVPDGKHRLSISLTWPGSDLDLQIKDPSGRVVGGLGPGSLSRKTNLVVATVPYPTAGPYTAVVTGTQVSPGGEDFFLSASTEGQTTNRHFAGLVGGAGSTTGPLASFRSTVRAWVTISALVAGLAMLLMTVRGLVRRLRARRVAARGERLPGKILLPLLLYLGVVGGLIALIGSAALNFLWETPLITLPKI